MAKPYYTYDSHLIKQRLGIELMPCYYCGGRPEVRVNEHMDPVSYGSTFVLYEVHCPRGHVVISHWLGGADEIWNRQMAMFRLSPPTEKQKVYCLPYEPGLGSWKKYP